MDAGDNVGVDAGKRGREAVAGWGGAQIFREKLLRPLKFES